MKKEQEARELAKKYGKKKAQEIAEKHFQENIEDIRRKEHEEALVKDEALKRNRAR